MWFGSSAERVMEWGDASIPLVLAHVDAAMEEGKQAWCFFSMYYMAASPALSALVSPCSTQMEIMGGIGLRIGGSGDGLEAGGWDPTQVW